MADRIKGLKIVLGADATELKKGEEAYGNDAQISEMEAYVLDGSNHDNYCWKITEI